MYAALSVQGFAVMLLLVSTKDGTKDLDEAILFIGFAVGVGKLRAEVLNGLFELRDFAI
jgi:hypothetical protein